MIAHSGGASHSLVIAAAIVAIATYGWAWLRCPTPQVGRLVAWATGVAAVVAATLPVTEGLADRSFTGHMVQHLVMIVVAAPMLALAHPAATFATGRPRWWVVTEGERRSVRVLRRWSTVSAPVAFLGVLFATHFTGVYDLALRSRWVHVLEHVGYLLSAVMLWSVVLAPNSAKAVGRIGAAFAVIAGSAALGVVLMSADRPLVATYARRLGTDGALDDQRLAASLMWVGGMASSLPLLMIAVWTWASGEQRRAERAEHLADYSTVE